MTLNPKISVVLPVFNGERFLAAAIDSVLKQTFQDFELIVVDNGSTDNTPKILGNYASKDARVRIERLGKNLGVAVGLNKGIQLAKGEFIARLDADDLCHPERLGAQVAFLEGNKEIGIVGSSVMTIDAQGRRLGRIAYPETPLAVQWQSMLFSPFAHPAVMMRSSLNPEYREQFEGSEDNDLWLRLLQKTEGANLDKALTFYRVHANSATYRSPKTKLRQRLRLLRIDYIRSQIPHLTASNEELLHLFECLQRYRREASAGRTLGAKTYLDLWGTFKDSYADGAEMKKLERGVILEAAKLIFYPAFQPKTIPALRAMAKVDPYWLLSIIRQFPKLMRTRLTSLRLRRERGIAK